MGNRGGKTATSWAGSWNLGKTMTIRIPEALEDEIMAYARARDAGECLLQGNNPDVVLSAIAAYKKIRDRSIHPNQFSKGTININTRAWDELRRFAKLVEEQPQLLGLK